MTQTPPPPPPSHRPFLLALLSPNQLKTTQAPPPSHNPIVLPAPCSRPVSHEVHVPLHLTPHVHPPCLPLRMCDPVGCVVASWLPALVRLQFHESQVDLGPLHFLGVGGGTRGLRHVTGGQRVSWYCQVMTGHSFCRKSVCAPT